MRLRDFAVLACLTLGLATTAKAASAPLATGDFDYYELTLSWSPGFCDTGGASKSPEQCATGAGVGFVVHGLWPDNFDRPYPADCSGGYVSGAALALTRGVYPAAGLARYEYLKHGTCTGLAPEDYFTAVRHARDSITIPATLQAPHEALNLSPDEIESAFIAANPNITRDNLAVTCARGELIDVRICLSKALDSYVNCPKVAGHSCRARSVSVSPVR